MGIDFNKMKQKMRVLEGKTGGIRWKPEKNNKYKIRIICPPDGDPFKKFFWHYNLGTYGFLSPYRNFGEDDPLNDYVRSLWDSEDEENIKIARKIGAKPRYSSLVLVRGEEMAGIQIWSYGTKVYRMLMDLVMDPDVGDFTDPVNGRDIELNYKQYPGEQYPTSTISKDDKCPLLPDPDEAAELLRTMPSMEDEFAQYRKTPEEVLEILQEYLSEGATDAEAEAASSTLEKYSGGDSASEAASAVDRAFGALAE